MLNFIVVKLLKKICPKNPLYITNLDRLIQTSLLFFLSLSKSLVPFFNHLNKLANKLGEGPANTFGSSDGMQSGTHGQTDRGVSQSELLLCLGYVIIIDQKNIYWEEGLKLEL